MKEIKLVKSNVIFPIIKELLSKGNSVRITVTGTSMYPFLRENIDSVELSPIYFKVIKRGDIVMIERDSGEYVMHRVIRKAESCFYIVGDAQQWIEGPIRIDQLIGKVSFIWRKDQKINCNKILWRLLSSLWLILLPARSRIIRLYSRIRLAVFPCHD